MSILFFLFFFYLVTLVIGVGTLLLTGTFSFTPEINGRPIRCFATSFALVISLFCLFWSVISQNLFTDSH